MTRKTWVMVLFGGMFLLAGCGQQAWTQPVQQTATRADQGQPTKTDVADNLYVFYNGPTDARVATVKDIRKAIEAGDVEAFKREIFTVDSDDRGASANLSAPEATYSMAISFIVSAQGEASQAGEVAGSATQSASADFEQRIRASVQAELQAQGLGQMQGTQAGNAGEGDASSQGGGMDQNLRLVLNYLKANPDQVPAFLKFIAAQRPATSQPAE